MEIDISRFIIANSDNMANFSSSPAASGLDNIGAITWRNVCALMSDKRNLLTDNASALIAHFREYGAWDASELASMSLADLNAMLAQEIASTWQAREAAIERCELTAWEQNEGGRIYQNHHNKRWYTYIGV